MCYFQAKEFKSQKQPFSAFPLPWQPVTFQMETHSSPIDRVTKWGTTHPQQPIIAFHVQEINFQELSH